MQLEVKFNLKFKTVTYVDLSLLPKHFKLRPPSAGSASDW
jgi:hypothetical protein